jgi:hypothetical protein
MGSASKLIRNKLQPLSKIKREVKFSLLKRIKELKKSPKSFQIALLNSIK